MELSCIAKHSTLLKEGMFMSQFSPAERLMWNDLSPEQEVRLSDSEINHKYSKQELRIITETNREQLPNFVAALERSGWMTLQPFYQRRQRWDGARKSKLIESFIMNIPVPPCFLYESEFARYEVMDGQQRISTIWDFYNNKFKLKGLEQWPELNGRSYRTLPSEVKRGLDRRSISYIVLLKESAKSSDEEMLLRQQVFERLNTGGVELTNQEIRHCLYHSKFDELLVQLSQHDMMRRAWGLALYSENEKVNPPKKLLSNPLYSKMRDVEFVLRFFALRHAEHYRSGMQAFLEQYMLRSRRFTDLDIDFLKNVFVRTINLAHAVYGKNIFRPWDVKSGTWSRKPQFAYADTILVGLSNMLECEEQVIANRERIVDMSKRMIMNSPVGTFTGQKNTKADVLNRLSICRKFLLCAVQTCG